MKTDYVAFSAAILSACGCYFGTKSYIMAKGFEHLPLPSLKTGGLWGFLVGHPIDESLNAYGNAFNYFKAEIPHPLKAPGRTRVVRHSVLFVAHPADIERVTSTRAENYIKDEAYTLLLGRLLGEGIFTQRDVARHAVHRKLLSPAFSPASLKDIAEHVVPEQAAALLDWLDSRAAEQNPFIVSNGIAVATIQVMAKAAFRTRTLSDTMEVVSQFQKALENQWLIIRLFPVADRLLFKQNSRVHGVRCFLAQKIREITEELKQCNTDPEGSVSPPLTGGGGSRKTLALIDHLIYTKKLTEVEILDNCITFMLAGNETTNATLVWLCYFLAKHPSVQQRLFEELCDAVAANNVCSLEEVQNCQYLKDCIKETLRLATPCTASAFVAQEDDVLPGTKTFIPKGTKVDVRYWRTHTLPELWGSDPETFSPDRWQDERSRVARDTSCCFLPFSHGRRNCIGKDFAMNEMLLLGAAMFRNFLFVWPEGEPEVVVVASPGIKAVDPIRLVAKRREHWPQ